MPIHLRDVTFSNSRIGIKTRGPIDLVAENVTFDNVEQPYNIGGARSVHVKGSRIRNDLKAKRTSEGGVSSVGWRMPNGPPLPVFCPSCKSIFPSRNYNLGGMYFNAWDNEEMCPECGSEHAKLSEGIFDLAGETLRILSAPDITHAMLLAIRDVAEDVVSGKIVPEEALQKFDAIVRVLGLWRGKP